MRRDSRQFEIFVQAQGGPQSKIVAEPKTSKMETRRDNLAYEQWRENLHRHSYDMDSRSLQTGLFLHQFTNSVSRALHKDNDQQSKRLSAEELYAKANPAIFTTNFNARSKVPTAQVHLPAISKLGVVGDLLNQNNNSLKFRLMKESRSPGKSRKAQSLQPHIVEDYHLPRIMEITDKEGNNWKIQQQQKSAKSSNDKVEAENERVPARIPPIEPLLVHDSVTAKPSAAESVGFGKRPNKTQDTQPKLPQINKNTHLTWEKKKDSETELEASDLEDESLDLNTPRRGQTDKFNPLSTYKSYQNKMSYSSYLKQMSLPDVHDTTAGLSPANVNDAGNCLQIRGKSTTNEESGDVKYKSLDVYCPRNDRESEESSSEKDSPAEEVMTPRRHGNKENATPRKDAETHKVEVGKHIPKNFTEKQQQELRSRYPMYDWQVANRQRSLGNYNGYSDGRTPRKMPSLESLSSISSHGSSVQRIKMFRMPSSLDYDALMAKKFKKKSKKANSDEFVWPDTLPTNLKTVTFGNVYEYDQGGDGRVTSDDIIAEWRASIEHAQYRHDKGLLYTGQPPPTPVERNELCSSAGSNRHHNGQKVSGENEKGDTDDTKKEKVESPNMDLEREGRPATPHSEKVVDKAEKGGKANDTEVDFTTMTENEKRTEHYSIKEEKFSTVVEVSSERYYDANPGNHRNKKIETDAQSDNSKSTSEPTDDKSEKSQPVALRPAIKMLEIPGFVKYQNSQDTTSMTSSSPVTTWKNKTESVSTRPNQERQSPVNVSTKDVVFISPAAYIKTSNSKNR